LSLVRSFLLVEFSFTLNYCTVRFGMIWFIDCFVIDLYSFIYYFNWKIISGYCIYFDLIFYTIDYLYCDGLLLIINVLLEVDFVYCTLCIRVHWILLFIFISRFWRS
jgi:hypothetical protein